MAIQLEALTKHFRGPDKPVEAVAGINVHILPGEVVAFLGPNGAGKTTTLDIVLGLTEPTSGSARVFQMTPREAIRAGRVGAVLQTGGLLRDMTVRETVLAIAALQGAKDRVDAVLEMAHLQPLARRKVSRCSGGEQQRIKFALALLTEPDLLVLDEPTAGLDVTARREFWESMHAQADEGRTIVFATHYLEEAERFADRIVLIAEGRIVADGPMAEIRALTHRRRVSYLLDGQRHQAAVTDSDALALAVLNRGASDLEITAPSLEEAFLALTSERSVS